MASTPQTYKNHARLVPLYHFVVLPLLTVNLVLTVRRAIDAPAMDTAWAAIMAMTVLVVAFYARVFALRAQDRVIRLEMRLRLREVLPADMRGQIDLLTVEQLVALRFAGDAEMPGLVARVLKDGIDKRKPIKLLIADWQADSDRV